MAPGGKLFSRGRLLALALLCGGARAAAQQRDAASAAPGLRCVLEVAPSGSEYGLRFALRNEGAAEASLRYWLPTMPRELRVTRGGASVRVSEPALDLPVHAVQSALPRGAELRLPSPVRLRFGGPAERAGTDAFLWTLEVAPGPAHLEALLEVSGATLSCHGELRP